MLAACAAEAPGPAPVLAGAYVALVPGEAGFATDPTAEPQTHPSLARDPSGGAWAAWDAGDGTGQRAELRAVGAEGAPEGPVTRLATAIGGYTTPDLVVDDGGEPFAVVRVADRVLGLRLGRDPLGPVEVGAGDLGFWTAPDLAAASGGLVVGWWDGGYDPGAPATYRLAQVDRDLVAVSEPVVVASSVDTGSPLALERLPDGGFVVAWSERADEDDGSIHAAMFDPAGVETARVRVDDVRLLHAPTRPALATVDGAIAVGWRAQDDAQVGAGTRLRRFDPDLVALGPSVALGLAPEATNRIELSAAEGVLAAAWEEATAEGDVVMQLFDAADGAPLTGPVRVHDDLAGRQARPTIEVTQGGAVLVAWESGEPPAIALRTFVLEVPEP